MKVEKKRKQRRTKKRMRKLPRRHRHHRRGLPVHRQRHAIRGQQQRGRNRSRTRLGPCSPHKRCPHPIET
eukprot:8483044-Pyramimonas_sp.AAC.1